MKIWEIYSKLGIQVKTLDIHRKKIKWYVSSLLVSLEISVGIVDGKS